MIYLLSAFKALFILTMSQSTQRNSYAYEFVQTFTRSLIGMQISAQLHKCGISCSLLRFPVEYENLFFLMKV